MKSIFISSTFRDFQEERDVLNREVLPLINEKAMVYGETVDFSDLRWGVDTSKMSEAKANQAVLSVCLDEIDKSRPRMIILLGNRYGYVPGEEEIEKQLRRRADFMLEDLRISVTQLEIEYGFLQNCKADGGQESVQGREKDCTVGHEKASAADHVFIYIRELSGDDLPDYFLEQNPEYREKLEALKRRIKELGGDHVRFYPAVFQDGKVTGLDAFRKMVLEDCLADLTEEWESIATLGVYEKEKRIQQNQIETLTRAFIYPRNVSAAEVMITSAGVKKCLPKEYFSVFMDKEDRLLFKELKDRISLKDTACEILADPINSFILPGTIKRIHELTDENAICAHRGGHGSGKTMFAVHLSKILQYMGWETATILCGASALTTSAEGVQRYLTYLLEEWAGVAHRDLEMLKPDEIRVYGNELIKRELFDKRPLRRRCMIIDGIDRLEATKLRNLLQFLPSEFNVLFRMFITLGPDFRLLRESEETQQQTTFVPEAFVYPLIKQVMHSTGKQLGEPVQDAIASKEGSKNPLYVKMAAERLCMMSRSDFEQIQKAGDGMNAINQYQIQLVRELPDSPEGIAYKLLSAAAKELEMDHMLTAMDYLAVSSNGLRKEDIMRLLERDGFSVSSLDISRYVNYLSSFFLLREDGCIDFSHAVMRKSVGLTETDQRKREIRGRMLSYFHTLPDGDSVKLREMAHLISADGEIGTVFEGMCYANRLEQRNAEKMAQSFVSTVVENVEEYVDAYREIWENPAFSEEDVKGVTGFISKYLSAAFGDRLVEKEANYTLMKGITRQIQISNNSRGLSDSEYLQVLFACGKSCVSMIKNERLEEAVPYFEQALELLIKTKESLGRDEGEQSLRKGVQSWASDERKTILEILRNASWCCYSIYPKKKEAWEMFLMHQDILKEWSKEPQGEEYEITWKHLAARYLSRTGRFEEAANLFDEVVAGYKGLLEVRDSLELRSLWLTARADEMDNTLHSPAIGNGFKMSSTLNMERDLLEVSKREIRAEWNLIAARYHFLCGKMANYQSKKCRPDEVTFYREREQDYIDAMNRELKRVWEVK